MKLRRTIAIILISFANVFILAHAVVPHSHHDGIVCFESEKNDNKHCAEKGSSTDCCAEEEERHTHLEDCDLPKMIERDGNPIYDSYSLPQADASFLVCVCMLHCYDYLAFNTIEEDILERYKPYVDTYNSPYIGSNFGLRAPPTNTIL